MGRSGVVLFLLFLGCFTVSAATASFISVDDLNSDGNAGRHLLQQKTRCTVNFENANYTIVTSKCKAPQYPAELCCPAFKELICPYRDYISDLKSNCSTVMFSYLNDKGSYPPSLFSSMCRDGKQGYNCTGIPVIGNQNSGCTVNFENANYTIVTSKCKAPQYPAELCCPAFKELIRPYRDYFNDLNSDCLTIMFSYLNAKGSYPPALFSSMCRDSKEGYNCTGIPVIGNQNSGCTVNFENANYTIVTSKCKAPQSPITIEE